MPESSDLDPLRQSVSDALKLATSADTNAAKALDISRKNSDQLMGLAVSQERTERSLSEHKVQSDQNHQELLNAIEGAKSTDAKQAAKIGELESKLSNADIGKIAGGVTALLVAVAGAITLAATQLAPVLPSVVQAKYGQPAVVIQTAPSAAPAGAGGHP